MDREGAETKTVVHHHRLIHEALGHAVDWQLLALNPATAAKPPRPAKAPITFFEPEEYARLRATAQGKEPHATLIEMGIATGMRQGELLALRWQDTDLVNGTITVNRTARRFTGKGIVYGAPKSYRSQRPVKLAADTKSSFMHTKRASPTRSVWLTRRNNDLVFCGAT